MAKKRLMVGEETLIISEEALRKKIYIIRGQRVMLDYDLAEIYGYETKAFNRQVKNNKEKFEGEDFMFQLNRNEANNILRCKNCTLMCEIEGFSRCQNGTLKTKSDSLMSKNLISNDLRCKNYTSKIINDHLISQNMIPDDLRSKNLTLKNQGSGSNIKYLPYVFAEQVIYMLMAIPR